MPQKQKKTDRMGLPLILAGLLILANPVVNIVDVFPDAVGYLLIVLGLGRLRDLALYLSEARKKFITLAAVEATKLIALYFSTFIEEGFLLVFSFCYTLAELCLALPAFTKFYDGLLMVAVKADSDAVTGQIDRIKAFTVLFLIIRSAATVLPELSYLSLAEGVGYVMAPFKGVIVVLCLIVSLVFGILFAVRQVRFYKLSVSDERFLPGTAAVYRAEIAPKKELFLLRRLRAALALLCTGEFLFLDLYFDGVNALPDWIGALFILGALSLILFAEKEYGADKTKPLPILILSGIYLIASLISSAETTALAKKYYYLGLNASADAYGEFVRAAAAVGIAAALLAALTVILCVYYFGYLRSHTARKVENGIETDLEREESYRREGRTAAVVWTVIGCITAAVEFISFILTYYLPAFWMADLAVHLIWGIFSVRLFVKLTDLTERRYS